MRHALGLWILVIGICGGAQEVSLVDTLVKVRPGEWEAVDVPVQQRGGAVECEFQMKGRGAVRVALMTRADEERFREGKPHSVLATTNYEKEGRLRVTVPETGRYVLVIDNRMEGRQTAVCRVKAKLVVQGAPVEAKELPWGRRVAVIGVSLGVFGLVAGFAGRRLWRAEPPEMEW